MIRACALAAIASLMLASPSSAASPELIHKLIEGVLSSPQGHADADVYRRDLVRKDGLFMGDTIRLFVFQKGGKSFLALRAAYNVTKEELKYELDTPCVVTFESGEDGAGRVIEWSCIAYVEAMEPFAEKNQGRVFDALAIEAGTLLDTK